MRRYKDTQVYSNSARSHGGGVYVLRGSAALTGTQVVSNSASSGGGLYINYIYLPAIFSKK